MASSLLTSSNETLLFLHDLSMPGLSVRRSAGVNEPWWA